MGRISRWSERFAIWGYMYMLNGGGEANSMSVASVGFGWGIKSCQGS